MRHYRAKHNPASNTLSILLISCLCSLLVGVAGCSSQKRYQLTSLQLPVEGSNCCWQATQELLVDYKDQHIQLLAVLVHQKRSVSLVLLDPFGRRLLSLQKTGDEVTQYRSPELPDALPEDFLLASSMLAWWPRADWDFPQGKWWLSVVGKRRQLSYGENVIVSVQYPDQMDPEYGMPIDAADITEAVVVTHHHYPLRITIRNQQWHAL